MNSTMRLNANKSVQKLQMNRTGDFKVPPLDEDVPNIAPQVEAEVVQNNYPDLLKTDEDDP